MNSKEKILKKINNLATKLECLDRYNYRFKGNITYFKAKNKKNNLSVFRFNNERIVSEIEQCDTISDIGIVMQGPILHDEGFTIDSIKIIKNNYPNIVIVLSTWKNEITDEERRELNSIGCVVIESKSCGDEYKGQGEKIGHLNNQIFSTKVGIEYLTKMSNIKYVLKMRTDICIYRPNFMHYLRDIQKLYDGENKIINIAFSNSLPGIPFHLSDFICFGSIEEMKRMYSIPYRSKDDLNYIVSFVEDKEKYSLYKKNIHKLMYKDLNLNMTVWKNINFRFMFLYHEESYITYNYAKLCGYTNTIESYLKFLKNKVIIIDDFDLMVYWKKSLYSAIQSNYSIRVNERFSHAKWLHLYLEDK